MKRAGVATALFTAMACGGEPPPIEDAGRGGPDAGAALADAAVEPDAGAALADAAVEPDAGAVPPDAGDAPTCGGATGAPCADGEGCVATDDCLPDSICNTPDHPLHDPAQRAGVCIQVLCRGDADCASGQVCTAERVCRARTCQAESDCPAGELCSAGVCAAPPPVDRCDVIGRPVFVREGTRVALEARVRDASGRVIGGAPLTWSSSAPARAGVEGGEVVGGREAGVADVTAVVTATLRACTGSVRVENVAPSQPGEVRVRVVDAHAGGPIDDARVVVFAGGVQHESRTDATGLSLIAGVADPLTSVTVLASEREYVSVLAPGTRDLLVPLERAPDPSQVGGFRGSVALPATALGQLGIGAVGPALPGDLSRFSLAAFTGQNVPTLIDAPQLGIQETADLPGNMMLSLGNQRFTVDVMGSDLRCQGSNPPADDLGCYVVAAPEGPGLGWAIARRAPLAEVSSIAGRLASAMGASDSPTAAMLALLPLFRAGSHGVAADLTTTAAPRVDAATGQPSALCSSPATRMSDARCRPDYAAFSEVRIAAEAAFTAHAAVSLPRLPRGPAGHHASGALVFAAAATGRRGLVPLGLGGGADVAAMGEAADGVVAGVDAPFGPHSEALPDGVVPLSVAPPHSGLEGSPLALVAVAFDEARSPDDNVGRRFSGLVEPIVRVAPALGFGGREFLGYATGVLDRDRAELRDAAAPAGSVLRIEIVRGRRAWRIYTATPSAVVELPGVLEARIDLLSGAGTPDVTLHALRLRAPAGGGSAYGELFTMGSGANLDRIGAVTEAFSMQVCDADARAPCRIE